MIWTYMNTHTHTRTHTDVQSVGLIQKNRLQNSIYITLLFKVYYIYITFTYINIYTNKYIEYVYIPVSIYAHIMKTRKQHIIMYYCCAELSKIFQD